MTWTGQTFSVGQILTAAQMNNLQADITAAFNKDGGAPVLATNYIVEAMMGSNAVNQDSMLSSAIGQAECKTTTGTVSTTSTSMIATTLAGGEYGFYTRVKSNSGTGQAGVNILDPGIFDTPGTSYVTRVSLNSLTSDTTTVQQRYFQASPPYDLGDGEIKLFVFVVVDSLGNIESTYVAPEAPWHHNGPTRITPDYYKKVNGILIPYRKRPKIITEDPDIRMTIIALYAVDRADDARAFEARLNYPELDDRADFEIDQVIKNTDMNLIPHPFIGNDLTGKTIVMLDPVSKFSEILLEMHEANANDSNSVEGISDLIHTGKIKLGSEDLTLSLPPGVISREIKF